MASTECHGGGATIPMVVRRATHILAGLAALGVAACAQTDAFEPLHRAIPAQGLAVDPSAAWTQVIGQNELFGTAYVTRAGGVARTCAGDEASILPATPSNVARLAMLYGPDRDYAVIHGRLPPRDPAIERATLHSACDAAGNFQFRWLPDGDYLVVAGIPGTPRASIRRAVTLAGGQARDILLAH